MIISHSRRFIFIKTMKTGGTSLEMALVRYCGPGDVITPLQDDEEELRHRISGRGAQNYTKHVRQLSPRELARLLAYKVRPEIYREHTPAWFVKQTLPAEIWNDYYKFAVVRHPFDRAVSRYFYSRKHETEHQLHEIWDRQDFDQYLRYRPEQINENWALYTERDVPLLDRLVRYERLESDLAEVSARIGLDHNIHDDMATIRAKGDSRPRDVGFGSLLTDRHKDVIAFLCGKEMQLMNYARDGLDPKRADPDPLPVTEAALG